MVVCAIILARSRIEQIPVKLLVSLTYCKHVYNKNLLESNAQYIRVIMMYCKYDIISCSNCNEATLLMQLIHVLKL